MDAGARLSAGGAALPSADELLARLRLQAGAERLLAVAPPGAYLVGGAVRDLLLGRAPRELDVVLAGERAPFGEAVADLAGALAARAGVPGGARAPTASSAHERFGTATVACGGARIDVATARRERYAAPGALPEVEPATLEEDLLRRDFTVNAIAVALDGADGVELRAAPHALEDLGAGRLRVLHERSFIDDPTRLWRLGRYRARLGFAVEERTARLAREAVAGGALATVSGARVGAELRLSLAEPDPPAALAELEELGVLDALHPRLRLERALVRRALALLGVAATGEEGARDPRAPGVSAGAGARIDAGARAAGRADLLILAALTLPLALSAARDGGALGRPAAVGGTRSEIAAFLDRLEFTASERDRVASAASAVPALIDELPAAARPSRLWTAVARVPPEGVALAGALSAPAAEPARRWLAELRDVRLRIDGGDLLAAGVAEGPEIGRRLEATLRMRLDGELPDEREAQLRAALAS
jgi:tRNA nucleotidyltransferase (CCA-adding enzyme)